MSYCIYDGFILLYYGNENEILAHYGNMNSFLHYGTENLEKICLIVMNIYQNANLNKNINGFLLMQIIIFFLLNI